jgi:hypothetical protein
MSIYPVALFLHVVAALGVFAGLALEWRSLFQLRRAARAEQASEWFKVYASLSHLYPLAWGLILIPGLYMTALVWHWVAWIVVALVAVFLLAGLGAAFSGRRMAAIGSEIAAEKDGLSPTLRSQLRDPILWASIQVRTAIALGIIFLMTVKPGSTGALLAIGAAVVIGLAASLPAWGGERSTRAGTADRVGPYER